MFKIVRTKLHKQTSIIALAKLKTKPSIQGKIMSFMQQFGMLPASF